jgi:hypothetical protein
VTGPPVSSTTATVVWSVATADSSLTHAPDVSVAWWHANATTAAAEQARTPMRIGL